jgi:hypothetical protein
MYIIFIYIFEKEKRTFAADTGITKNLDKKKKRKTEVIFLLNYKYIISIIIVIF